MILTPILVFALLALARHWSGTLLASALSAGDIAAVNRALVVAMIVAASVFADGLVRYFYWHRYWRRRRDRETPALIRDLMTIAIVMLGLSFALWWVEGLSFTGLVTASGATAIILGIALQTVIQDLFSGLSINLEGSYGLGDWLTIYSDQMPAPAYGQVSAMTWRSTNLTQLDGRSLMVPNHLITANAVLNHSRPANAKRLTVEIPLDARIPSEHVIEMLQGEALKTVRGHRLASLPTPSVHIDRLSSDSAFYHVFFYADPALVSPDMARSVMYRALLEAVQRNALPMPVTQIEISPRPELDFRIGAPQIEDALCGATLFRSVLDDAQRTALAGRCTVRQFQMRDVLMRQGDATASMFIILSGGARVTVLGGDGHDHEVAVLAMGDVVGEISLMTGAPRTASVTAMTRMQALEITKDAIAPLMEQAPELLHRFSDILAIRQQELDALANRPATRSSEAHDLLSRMRAFFGYRRG
jgi:small-conductance mechanosensitive channel/CRP-like cAMP-binding protein